MIQAKTFGNAVVLVSSDEFANGVQAGYLYFTLDFSGRPIPEHELQEIIAARMSSSSETAGYNTGFVVGLISAMYKEIPIRRTHPVSRGV